MHTQTTAVDGGPRLSGRLAHKLRYARLEAERCHRRTRCAGCGELRDCGPLDVLAFDAAWLCFRECWPYHLGLLHGKQLTIRELKRAASEIELVVAQNRGSLQIAG
jgi:hypothetical protein